MTGKEEQIKEMRAKHKEKVAKLKNSAKELGLILVSKSPDLIIGRVPKKELDWFKKWADEDFEGDYGMALKWMSQAYMPPENTEIAKLLEDQEVRLQALENKHGKNSDEKTITLGNGTTITKRN